MSLICCVFRPCCEHPKAGRNIFQPFLFISKLFQWFHGRNQQKNVWYNNCVVEIMVNEHNTHHCHFTLVSIFQNVQYILSWKETVPYCNFETDSNRVLLFMYNLFWKHLHDIRRGNGDFLNFKMKSCARGLTSWNLFILFSFYRKIIPSC